MSNQTLRLAIAFLGAAILASACSATDTERAANTSSDGVLDCDQGLVERSTDIVASGATEEEVVETALADWTSLGAVLVAVPAKELWAASLDGRDVATATVERNGDGSWVTHAVSTCGEPEMGPAAIDGELDCRTDTAWTIQASVEADAQGAAIASEALEESLEQYLKRHGGEIVFIGERVASLVIDEREQVLVRATQLENGTWLVLFLEGCDGFQR